MKTKFYLFASILVVLCMICSCGGSGGSAESEAQQVVAVSFDVASADGALRVASVTNPVLTNVNDLTFEYMATAAWNSSEFGKPKGDTNGAWVSFNPYVSAQNKGTEIYFAQGKWTIQVQVKKGNVVIYKNKTTGTGYSSDGKTQYINATNTSDTTIEIEVEKNYTGKGSIVIENLYTPDTSGTDKLVVTYGKLGTTTGTTVDFTASANATSVTTGSFAGYNNYGYDSSHKITLSDIDAGAYWVTVGYHNGTEVVGASTVTADVIVGLDAPVISGSIQNGVWTSKSIKVVGVNKIEATISYTSTTNSLTISSSANPAQSIEIACEATVTDIITGTEVAGTMNYKLFANGLKDSNSTGSFTFEAGDYAPGTYSIYVIAEDTKNKLMTNATTEGESPVPALNVTVNP